MYNNVFRLSMKAAQGRVSIYEAWYRSYDFICLLTYSLKFAEVPGSWWEEHETASYEVPTENGEEEKIHL